MSALSESTTAPYVSAFARSTHGATGWTQALRQSAIERFDALGFPSSKLEAWRHTNVTPLTEASFALATMTSGPEAEELARFSGPRLVFVNGVLAPTLSRLHDLPPGVQLRSLSEAVARDEAARPFLGTLATPEDAFVALNTAFWSDGALLFVDRGAAIEAPVHVVFWAKAAAARAMSCPRLLVVAGENSRLTLVESHLHSAAQGDLSLGVSELFLAAGARVDHVQIIEGAHASHHLGATRVRQGQNSHYGSHLLLTGGALARRDAQVQLAGAGAYAELYGLYVGRHHEHVDCLTFVDHAVPHTTSREIYKGVLAEQARGVFNGKVVVRPGAQHTDASQHNRNLLLSKGATAHTRPQLEIYADDVKCVHGATVGQLDPDSVFYLRSRGIDMAAARQLLVQSFLSEVLAHFPEGVRALAAASTQAHLEAA